MATWPVHRSPQRQRADLQFHQKVAQSSEPTLRKWCYDWGWNNITGIGIPQFYSLDYSYKIISLNQLCMTFLLSKIIKFIINRYSFSNIIFKFPQISMNILHNIKRSPIYFLKIYNMRRICCQSYRKQNLDVAVITLISLMFFFPFWSFFFTQ